MFHYSYAGTSGFSVSRSMMSNNLFLRSFFCSRVMFSGTTFAHLSQLIYYANILLISVCGYSLCQRPLKCSVSLVSWTYPSVLALTTWSSPSTSCQVPGRCMCHSKIQSFDKALAKNIYSNILRYEEEVGPLVIETHLKWYFKGLVCGKNYN